MPVARRRALFSLLGFTFPLEHGLKEAAEIRNDAAGSNPRPRVFSELELFFAGRVLKDAPHIIVMLQVDGGLNK